MSIEGLDVKEISAEKAEALRFLAMQLQGEELEGIPPVKANMDLINSIDLKKGCFLGQELTARSVYNGIVRQRPFFVFISKNLHSELVEGKRWPSLQDWDSNFNKKLKGSKIKDKESGDLVKVVRNCGNFGIGFASYLGRGEKGFNRVVVGEDGLYYHLLVHPGYRALYEQYEIEVQKREEKMKLLEDL